MRVVRTVADLRSALAPCAPRSGRSIGLVPTMGALHDGPPLPARAARRRCDLVVMSLFVNPAQFGPGEDLDRYPRDEERDLALAEARGCRPRLRAGASRRSTRRASRPRSRSAAVSPMSSTATRAAAAASTSAASTTVVAKLFNTVGPDVAFFGQKDAQQAAVIRRMARDLDFAVEIAVIPTVREPDGLAMSSRNAYLARTERGGRRRSPRPARRRARAARASARCRPALEAARAELDAAGIEPEYLEARDPET